MTVGRVTPSSLAASAGRIHSFRVAFRTGWSGISSSVAISYRRDSRALVHETDLQYIPTLRKGQVGKSCILKISVDLDQALPVIERAIGRASQSVVAERIGVDPSVLSRWRSGDTQPTGKGRERVLAWAESQQASQAVVAESSTNYKASQESPIQRLFAEGASEQRAFLWRYTVALLEAMTEQIKREGPPLDLADIAARSMRDFKEPLEGATRSAAAK